MHLSLVVGLGNRSDVHLTLGLAIAGKNSDIIFDSTFFPIWISVVMVIVPGGNINEDDLKALMCRAQLL